MITIETLYKAHDNLKDVVIKTPIIEASHLNTPHKIYLKCENLQKTGSFKIRGAYNFLSQLNDEEKRKGVIAWSAGNHAQGVAMAAKMFDIPATICIPKSGSVSKIRETKRLGADVILVDGVFDDTMIKAKEIQKELDLVAVPPFEDEAIITGQASVGLEILEDIPQVQAVVVPIGGGGLIAGVAKAIKSINPKCKVIGVESQGAASMYKSLQQNKVDPLTTVDTIADGIAVKSPGSLTFEMTKEYVDEVITVSDYEIFEAMLHLMEHNHLIVEGAGAAGFAAIKFNKYEFPDNTVCVISGGNIDVELLNKVVRKALQSQKRLAKLKIEIEDRVGVLDSIISTIAKYNGNIVSVHHDRLNPGLRINSCITRIEYEVSDTNHTDLIEQELLDKGFKFLESSSS